MKVLHDVKYRMGLSNYFRHVLNETRHIVTEFSDVTSWIIDHLDEFGDELTYTGWNWHISTKICSNDENINSGYPIFVCLDSNMRGETFGVVEERDISLCSINMHINPLYRNDKFLYSKLSHEFVHIRTMYAKAFYNPLTTLNNKYDLQDISYFYNKGTHKYSLSCFSGAEEDSMFSRFINYAQNMLYLLSKTEQ